MNWVLSLFIWGVIGYVIWIRHKEKRKLLALGTILIPFKRGLNSEMAGGILFAFNGIIQMYCLVKSEQEIRVVLTKTVIALWIASYYMFKKGFWQPGIYENGILVNAKLINWRQVITYKWSDIMGYQQQIYDLYITIEHPKWKEETILVKIPYGQQAKIEQLLEDKLFLFQNKKANDIISI